MDAPTRTLPDWLRAVMDLTGAMRRAARAQAWGELAELEAQRRDALVRLFEPVSAVSDLPALAEVVRWMLAVDREIIERGEAARREAGEAITMLEHRRRATAAYQAVAEEG